jgi:CRP-like cAMP-binding protein
MTFLKLPFAQTTEVSSALTTHPLFAGVAEAAMHVLLSNGLFRQLREAQFIFHERDAAQSWYLLQEGEMESVRYGADGEERIFCHMRSPELIAEVLMFVPDGRYPVGIRARTPCRLFQMRRQDLHRLCEIEPRVALRLLGRASQRLCQRIGEVERMARTSASERLADYLLQQRERQGKARIELPLSQRQLAATLGIRAETLNRLLADWSQRGLIHGKRRQWEIRIPETLGRIAGMKAAPQALESKLPQSRPPSSRISTP